MPRYSKDLINKIRKLRSLGKTYGEIRQIVKLALPKSTLSDMCKKVKLPEEYEKRIAQLNLQNLDKAQRIARGMNKIKREEFFSQLEKLNTPIAKRLKDKEIAKIALAMLCLGEASKYNPKGSRSFSLGNSDPRIIVLFLKLLEYCFDFNQDKIRCTVQCRADQDTVLLEDYWRKVTKIPARLFYKARIDPRTIGKPTKKTNYKGVLKINYFDTKVQHNLEFLADLVYNYIKNMGPKFKR